MSQTNHFTCYVLFDYTEYTVVVDNYPKKRLKYGKLRPKLAQLISCQAFTDNGNNSWRVRDNTRIVVTGSDVMFVEDNDQLTGDGRQVVNEITIRINGQEFMPNKTAKTVQKDTKPPRLIARQQVQELNYLFVETVDKASNGLAVDWNQVSQQMSKFGHQGYRIPKCIQVMYDLKDKYYKILLDHRTVGTDKIQWKLFDKLNQMDLNQFFSSDKWQEICLIRQEMAINKNDFKKVVKTENKSMDNAINVIDHRLSQLAIASNSNTRAKVKPENNIKPKTLVLNNKSVTKAPQNSINTRSPSIASSTSSASNNTDLKADVNQTETNVESFDRKCFVEFGEDILNFVCNSRKSSTFKRDIIKCLFEKKGVVIATKTHDFMILEQQTGKFTKLTTNLLKSHTGKDIKIRIKSKKKTKANKSQPNVSNNTPAKQPNQTPLKSNDSNNRTQSTDSANKNQSNINRNLAQIKAILTNTDRSPNSKQQQKSQTDQMKNQMVQMDNQTDPVQNKKFANVWVEIEGTDVRFPVKHVPKHLFSLRKIVLGMIEKRFNWRITGKTHLFAVYDEKSRTFVEFSRGQEIDGDLRIGLISTEAFKLVSLENQKFVDALNKLTQYPSEVGFQWSSVSKLMQSQRFSDFDEEFCKKRFNDLIGQYMTVMETFDNLHNANAFWPLFGHIHKLDLQVLCAPDVYDKIMEIIEGPPPIDVKVIDWKRIAEFRNFCANPSHSNLFTTGKIDNKVLSRALSHYSISTIEEQIVVFREKVLLTEDNIANRVELKNLLESMLKAADIDCTLQFFGSTANSMGFQDSDIDLFVDVKILNNSSQLIDYKTALNWLNVIREILKDCINIRIQEPIRSKRCPIIKLDFKHLSDKFIKNPELKAKYRKSGINCDINLSNPLGVRNTLLIHTYCQYDRRFQDMALILRFWAKTNDFIDGQSGFTSYAFTQLVIFFCQTVKPPVLPSVDRLNEFDEEDNKTYHKVSIEGWDCSFCEDISLIPKSENKDSVIELMRKFFEFYSKFDFTTQVIRPKTGQSIHKKSYHELKEQLKTSETSKNSDNLGFKFSPLCCIEDPFKLEHNLTANLIFEVFDRFLEYIKYMALRFESFFSPNISPNISQSDNLWGISKIVTEFDPTPGYRSFKDRFICYPELSDCLEVDSREIIKSITSLSAPGLQTTSEETEDNARSVECTPLMVIKALISHVISDIKLILSSYDITPEVNINSDPMSDDWNQLAVFTLELNELYLQIIDSALRQTVSKEMPKNKKDPIGREKAITDELKKRMSGKTLKKSSVKCQFCLMCYPRPTCPYLEFTLLDITPANKTVTLFVKNLFIKYFA